MVSLTGERSPTKELSIHWVSISSGVSQEISCSASLPEVELNLQGILGLGGISQTTPIRWELDKTVPGKRKSVTKNPLKQLVIDGFKGF